MAWLPFFRKPDPGDEYFKQAQRYANPNRAEFDLNLAIEYLEQAISLAPDNTKYRSFLEELRLQALRGQSASQPRERADLLEKGIREVLSASKLIQNKGFAIVFQQSEDENNRVTFIAVRGEIHADVAGETLRQRESDRLLQKGFVKREAIDHYEKHFPKVSPASIAGQTEWLFRDVYGCGESYEIRVI